MEDSIKISKIKPMVSIIVPSYNSEQFLSNCLNSILLQTYDNLEVIVVNDGSTDNTEAIVKEYKKNNPEKIKYIVTENQGVLRARITGIKVASGEWIGFVDSDDVIESDMYQRLIENAITYNADISHCGYQTIVNGGERIHYFYNTGRIVKQDNTTGLKDLLEGIFVEPGLCNKLFHKALFHSLLYDVDFPEGIKINEDLLMNYYLFKSSKKSIYEDFCPYHYLTRSTSATRSAFNAHKVLDPVKVRKIILNDVTGELKDIAWCKYLICCRGAYEVLFDKADYKIICESLKDALKDNQDKWCLLSKKEKGKLYFTLYAPRVYRSIYRFYERHFQRKIYE